MASDVGIRSTSPARDRADAKPQPGSDASEADSVELSVGRYLSRQRRLRGISLAELASLTKIPLRSLERLENGHFDGDHDGFVRGFVRTVSLALGLDPDDTVARMLSEVEISEEPRYFAPPLLRIAVVVGLLIGVAGILGIGRALVEGAAGDAVAADALPIYRQDPVRALAEAQSASSRRAPSAPAVQGAPVEAPAPGFRTTADLAQP